MLSTLLEGLTGFGKLLAYYLFAAASAASLTRLFGIPKEPRRKLFHLICAFSIFVLLYGFRTWYVSALSVLALALIIYPLLSFAERYPQYREILGERRGGEVKTSALIIFATMAFLTAVFWGWQDTKYVIIVAIMTWGFGDAAAALVGKAWGKHFIRHRLVDGKKTIEGTLAMQLVAGFVAFASLLALTDLRWYLCLVVALLVAPVCALTELFTKWGLDTVTVPVSAAISTFVLVSILTRLGG